MKARPFKAGRSALVVERPLFFGFARVYDAVAARGRDEALVTRSFDEALGWLGCAPSLERRLRDLLSDGAYQARLARRKAG